MAARKKPQIGRQVRKKARQLLEFGKLKAQETADWVELHNALFGISGKANELFTNESERTAFAQTAERKLVYALLDDLPSPTVKEFGELLSTANGTISVRLLRSVHAELLAEAKAEGLSLNQLCLSKLVVPLRGMLRSTKPPGEL